ncbi:MAG: carbon starvation protein A [Bacteroidales bacterium]|nr:carbon starvation protein A [Bacteroidales bacterium]
MITFYISLTILIAGYFFYGKLCEHIFGADKNRMTPAIANPDGVDYIVLPNWKIFLIQFLNIAGLGPVFGAIMGAKFGSASFLWIVFGCIFAGAMHDYFAGMISLRNNGEGLPTTIGRYLGKHAQFIMQIFTIFLLIIVSAVFTSGPANLLAGITPEYLDDTFWIFVIFGYYIIATLFPINKIIGRIYPIFGFALLFMAVGILGYMIIENPNIPEFHEALKNSHPDSDSNPIFPMMFVSIACGAISGFHATQSPLMARCMKNEKQGRPIFFGAMITEGIVALIWAAAATYFFSPEGQQVFGITDESTNSNAATITNLIANNWLGIAGGLLAILGVIAAPISTGDTALRSARLIIADFFKFEQKSLKRRLIISIPLFVATITILLFSLLDKNGFEIIWRYFAWSNQVLAVITLWAIAIFLRRERKGMWWIISYIPALFMTAMTLTFILFSPVGAGLSYNISVIISIAIATLCGIWFIAKSGKKEELQKSKNQGQKLTS